MAVSNSSTGLSDFLSDLSSSGHSNDFILQVCFGIFGAIGTLITLASLHYRDSLGCMLIRRRFITSENDLYELPNQDSAYPGHMSADLELGQTPPLRLSGTNLSTPGLSGINTGDPVVTASSLQCSSDTPQRLATVDNRHRRPLHAYLPIPLPPAVRATARSPAPLSDDIDAHEPRAAQASNYADSPASGATTLNAPSVAVNTETTACNVDPI